MTLKIEIGTVTQLNLQIGDRIKSYALASGTLVVDGVEYVIVRREGDKVYGKKDSWRADHPGVLLGRQHNWLVISRAADTKAEPDPNVGTLRELKVRPGDEVQLVESEFTNSDQVGEIYLIAADGRVKSKEAPNEYYGYWDSLTSNQGSRWHLISRAADTKSGKGEPGWTGEYQPDETPLGHFDQPANDNDGVPQTSKDAYAEIARSLGHAVMAHVEAGDYEQAMKCAALMRRAEMEPVESADLTRYRGPLYHGKFSGSAAWSKDDLA